MTVSTTTNKVSYIGNGIATEFAIPFPFLETAHLKVYQLLNDIQTKRTDWTVSNGNMIFETPPANGAQIVILREVPLTQETDYQENEILAAETLERNFDRLTMQVQQLKEQSERAVTVDIFDDTQAADLLPSIRTAVSDAAAYAQTACQKADDAAQASAIATAQATIATNKANEAGTTLASKLNTDVNNLTVTGKTNISALAMPSTNYINLTLQATGTVYTASADGYVVFNAYATDPAGVISLLTHPVGINTQCTAGGNGNPYLRVFLPVAKNTTFRAEYSAVRTEGTGFVFRFFYAKGAC